MNLSETRQRSRSQESSIPTDPGQEQSGAEPAGSRAEPTGEPEATVQEPPPAEKPEAVEESAATEEAAVVEKLEAVEESAAAEKPADTVASAAVENPKAQGGSDATEQADAREAAESEPSSRLSRVRAALSTGTARVRAIQPPASRRCRILVAAAMAALLLAGSGAGVWWWSNRLPDGVAYRIAGQDVEVADLDREIETLGALYGVRPPDRQADPDGYATFRRDMAKASAIGRVVDAAAAARGVVIPERSVQDFLGRYVEQYFGAGDDARRKFVSALGDAGTSEKAVLRELSRQMAASRLFEQLTKDVPAVTDAETEAAFTARKDQLATPERRTLANIVVADEQTARQVRAQIDGGAAFADVARARSADAATKDQGGAIGTLAASDLEAEFATAAFAAPQGSVFGPVRTSHGWNVGVVNAVTLGAPADPAALHEPLRAQLLAERRNDMWRDFLGGELAAADVRYAEEYRPADEDALPPAPTAVAPR